ncbi:MAG: IclR family transcriptional regulator [Ramlibacter sp.]|jgi:DNA-binding IclR family transcriptional regulator|nr:IclR family transcriptional regulator [Ramlibacter sp.]
MKRADRAVDEAEPDERLEGDREQQGVQALETGLRLLEAFATTAEPMRLTEVALAADMHPAKAHRYLVSFIRRNYVMQAADGRYQLGPAAVKVGLSAVAQMDYVRLVTPLLTDLSVALNETVFAAVWSPEGPMILRIAAPWRPVAVNVRIGALLPMLTSAVGRVFTTWHPAMLTRPLIEAELEQLAAARRGRKVAGGEVDAIRAEVLAAGVGIVRGDYVPGVNSVCAPIFDYQHQLVAALAVVGLEGSLGDKQLQAAAVQLRSGAAEISSQLGHKPSTAVQLPDPHAWG